MRHGLVLAASIMLWAASAAAQDEEEEEKGGDEEGKPSGGMMDSGDPADTEKADQGPYAPTGKTGELKEEAEAEGRAAGGREKPDLPQPRKPNQVFGELLVGFGNTPMPGPEPDLDATLFTIVVGGGHDFSKKFRLGLRVPWSTGTIDDPERSQSTSTQALGSPELLAEYRVILSPRTDIPLELGIGVPIAQGNPDFTSTDTPGKEQARINALADAASGWRDGELFAPKRLPVVPLIGIRHRRSRLSAHTYTKMVFLVDTGTGLEEPTNPVGTFSVNSLAMRWVFAGGAQYAFLPDPFVFGGLESWMVYNLIEPIEFQSGGGGDEPSKFQLVFEPRVGATFGAVTPSIGYLIPAGGQLADVGINGLRVRVEASF